MLSPTQGNEARGTLTFTDEGGKVHVSGELTGLTPGDHGIHIHETGDCSAPDAASAGEHFAPAGMPHGSPDAPQHHAGDLGNVTADASGRAQIDRDFDGLGLNGANSILGRAVIVHSGRDDLTSQPSGASGARVACGVIMTK
jgi:Cu-Zn family superoxide dismutase